MGEVGIVQIIAVIAIILALLFRRLLQRAQESFENQKPDHLPDHILDQTEDAPVMQIDRQTRATPAPQSTPRASRSRVHESQGPNVRTPPGGSHYIRQSLLKGPRDVRRGIILMTILGPCRAFDPPN